MWFCDISVLSSRQATPFQEECQKILDPKKLKKQILKRGFNFDNQENYIFVNGCRPLFIFSSHIWRHHILCFKNTFFSRQILDKKLLLQWWLKAEMRRFLFSFSINQQGTTEVPSNPSCPKLCSMHGCCFQCLDPPSGEGKSTPDRSRRGQWDAAEHLLGDTSFLQQGCAHPFCRVVYFPASERVTSAFFT